MPQRPIITEDYTAPLGLDRPAPRRRRIVLWPLAAALAAILVAGVGLWTLLVQDPYGGQPVATADLPVVPPNVEAPAAAKIVKVEPPDDPSGKIIIRDP